MKLSLKVSKSSETDVRKGIIRIEEYTRNKIDSGTLVLLKFNNKTIPRVILGTLQDSSENEIFMDEQTRKILGLKDYDFNNKKSLCFKIIELNGFQKFWNNLVFYHNHPDFVTRFTVRMTMYSYFIAVMALLLTMLQIFTSNVLVQKIIGSVIIIIFALLVFVLSTTNLFSNEY